MVQSNSHEVVLRQMCEDDDVVHSICRYFGARTRIREVKVETIVRALERAAESDGTEPPGYYDVIKALKKIVSAADHDRFGRFLAGRKGRDSRFKLTQSIIDYGATLKPHGDDFNFVQDEEDEDEDEDEDSLESNSAGSIDWFEHTIRIRDGLAIKLKLPKDLTEQEARKLAGIIQHLYA